jgi:ribonuclease HIII
MEPGNELLKTYESIKLILKTGNVEVSDYQLIDYGLQFTISMLDWSGIIRIYQNKKGALKIDYSQLKEGVNAIKVKTLIESKRAISNLNNSDKNDVELGFPIIGTDESGKGDYFGPLVSAGVYVDEQTAKDLMACGVKDSKKLSDSKNSELAQKVAEICKGRFAIIEISPEKYNDLYEQFKREKKNLNTLLAWGHAKAIEEILSKVDCKVAIADQFADESFIFGKLQEKGKKLELIQMHKAEENIAVAAASILARARFLEKLSKLSNEYKIDLPKGASQTVIENARKFVDMYGKELLRKVAKLHFKTTTKVFKR